MYKIKKGLNVPITGQPKQVIESSPHIKKVAVLGGDYNGMKPTMKVKVGDDVEAGSVLFEDKKNPGVLFTAPVAGKVIEINRGHQRVLQSVVIAVSGQNAKAFDRFTRGDLATAKPEDLCNYLVQTGLWTLFRTRPFSRTPVPGSRPHSIFVTAMDTNPLAADVNVVMKGQEEYFKLGCTALSRLTDSVYVCSGPDSTIPHGYADNIKSKIFTGPHPSGLAGTHIHFVDPVGKQKTVWSINYQDVIAIGRTMTTGTLDSSRIVSLAGPKVKNPCLVKTTVGASIDELLAGRLESGDIRRISGSVLSGRTAQGPEAYLGRFHYQVTAIAEGRERVFLGWQRPGFDKFSVTNIFAAKMIPGKKFAFTSSTEGSVRAMVPIGLYEKVMPLDVEPTYLLRSLFIGDTEQSQKLGVLELDEEDLALCTFVCPTKEEYGPLLRKNLARIEKEG